MPNEDSKILKHDHGEKSIKTPSIIYAYYLYLLFMPECSLKNIHLCQNNPEKSYIDKKTMHEASGYSMFTYCSFDSTKKKVDVKTVWKGFLKT